MNHASDSTNRRSVLERALRTIEEMQSRLDSLEREKREPVAIVGMSCRFPGQADSIEAYWDLLCGGIDAIREVPPDRWDINAFYDPDPDCPGKMYTRMGGFLENVDKFDAHFFGMSPRETLKTDPQQRLAAEVSWEALEDAGIDPKDLAGSQTGVFLGITNNDYARIVERAGLEAIDAYHLTGNCLNFAAGRIAYLFGFQGPTLAVDTACSSSGVSVHLASQSLRNRECKLALAGGVNLILSPEISITSSKARTLSSDGHCKTFDASANGYVRGEGCGMVVLKRLADALADGDRIHAVIRGSAVNQDGATSGITVPNKAAQVEVIRQALERAGIEPGQVDYVEAHGTGTPLGDPIEIRALAEVYGKRSADRPLIIGTVKTNVGHLESAAGVAGLIKTVLSLEHGIIPAHLHFKKLNPAISLDEIPAVIPLRQTPWPGVKKSRVAAVSSFGGSGTIAHLIVEQGPQPPAPSQHQLRSSHLCCLSAKDAGALDELAGRYERRLAAFPAGSLADVCYTADAGRSHFEHRLAIVSSTMEQLRERLSAFRAGEDGAALAHGESPRGQRPRVVFLFTGQGGQYVNMARQLYRGEPVFRRVIDRCDELLRPHLARPLRSVLYPEPGESTPLDETRYTHVAMFAVQYGLATLWRSWGVEPSLVMGHSVGEIVAATVAGQMSFEDGLALMRERGRLMHELPSTGLMASFLAGEVRIAEAILPFADGVSIAAINGPESTVISGERQAVQQIVERLAGEGVKAKILKVSNAFHSPLVELVLADFEKAATAVRYSPPQVPLFSSMRLEMVQPSRLLEANYWRHNLRNTVRFYEAMRQLYEQGYRLFVEIGPSPILAGMGSQCVPAGEGTWLASLREERDDWQQMLESLGQLYSKGVEVNWRAFYQDRRARKVSLPSYPFQRDRYWVDAPAAGRRGTAAAVQAATTHPLLGARLRSAIPTFEQELSRAKFPFLDEHRVFDTPVFPMAAYMELAQAAAAEIFAGRQVAIKNLVLLRPLSASETKTIQVVASEAGAGRATFRVFSIETNGDKSGTEWMLHASAEIATDETEHQPPETEILTAVQRRCASRIDAGSFYDSLGLRGFEFGPDFKGIRELWKGDSEAIAHVEIPQSISAVGNAWQLHPAFLDACLQPVAAVLGDGEAPDAESRTYLPHRLESFRLYRRPGDRVWSHVRMCGTAAGEGGEIAADIRVVDSGGHRICDIRRLVLRPARREPVVPFRREDLGDSLYEIAWEETPRAGTALSADFLPDPVHLARSLEECSPAAESGQPLGEFTSLLPRLEALSTGYLQQALEELGWGASEGHCFTTESAARDLQVAARYRRLLGRIFEVLAEDGYLAREGSLWSVVRMPVKQKPETELATLLRDYPACSAELMLVGRCGRHFAEAMRGKTEPLELLFPNGSLHDVERLYKDSQYFRFYNRLIAQAIAEAASRVPMGRRLQILEIGGGTGSATSFVLPRLPELQAEYVFTDISPMFLAKAREKFAAYPFVNYRVLDIEKDPSAQGFDPAAFDVVLAANVLHATADLRRSLEHAQMLLRPDGLLLLLEATRPLRFVDVVVGLTEGWWRFADTDLRLSHPLLPAEKWRSLLTAIGFGDIQICPQEHREYALANQAVILARSPSAVHVSDKTDRAVSILGRRRWLVVAEDSSLSRDLQQALTAHGDLCSVVSANDGADFGSILAQAADRGQVPLDEVICVLPGGAQGVEENAGWEFAKREIRTGCRRVLQLVHAFVELGQPQAANLWIVSRGAQPVYSMSELALLRQAPAAALVRTLSLEYPELHCVTIDLDPDSSRHQAGDLLAEIDAADYTEQLIALRNGRRFAARLVRSNDVPRQAQDPDGGAREQPYRLTISSAGVLDHLRLSPIERRAPSRGEVEIEAHVTGLGFRDVLIALGQYPGSLQVFGYECAGKVVGVGLGNVPFEPGQRVLAVAPGGFSSHLTIPANRVVPIPDCLSDEEAATIPSAFLTAQYALCRLGKMSAGDGVLIHAAAGGVGLAAVQLAQRAGAEIFATAGSPEKRAFLKSLGVQHVMDSRSLDFSGEIMDITSGRGVDLVLNCLAGEFISKSLSVTAENGRFLEIGRTGIWDEAQVERLNRNLSYYTIDLPAEFDKQPALLRSLFDDLLPAFANGSLRPLPFKTFPVTEAAAAFRFMAQARHTGKIVLIHKLGGKRKSVSSTDRGELALSPDGAYLITGGLSGLGLLAAQWMFERGACHLVLLGRRSPSERAAALLREMEQQGARVLTVSGDVSDRQRMAQLFSQFGRSLPALRGIIHSAGTLEDGVLAQQTWERFEKVMAPKVDGAWHLHALSQDQPLDFFVLFSSAVAMLGSAGQGNHVAACAFEDALAHYRRNLGLPALSINWGPWSEIGAATQGTVSERLRMKGFRLIEPRQGLEILEQLLLRDSVQIGAMFVDWRQYAASLPPGYRSKLLSKMCQEQTRAANEARKTAQPALLEQLRQTPAKKRRQALEAYIREQAIKVLGLSPSFKLDHQQGLASFGMDSLMTIELKNRLQAAVQKTLSATIVFDHPTVSALAEYLNHNFLEPDKAKEAAAEGAPQNNGTEMLAEVAELSDEEAEAILLRELSNPA